MHLTQCTCMFVLNEMFSSINNKKLVERNPVYLWYDYRFALCMGEDILYIIRVFYSICKQ